MKNMTKEELLNAAQFLFPKAIGEMSLDEIYRLMTITQHVTDVCLKEVEDREELTVHPENGAPIVPYHCDYYVETILTRPDNLLDYPVLSESELVAVAARVSAPPTPLAASILDLMRQKPDASTS